MKPPTLNYEIAARPSARRLVVLMVTVALSGTAVYWTRVWTEERRARSVVRCASGISPAMWAQLEQRAKQASTQP